MDDAIQGYVDGIAAEHRALFDRVSGLILRAYPDAVVKLSYGIPSYWVGKRKLYVGVWRHGLSVYGWPQGGEREFMARYPALKTSKGIIQIRPRDATEISDGELLELVHAALGG